MKLMQQKRKTEKTEKKNAREKLLILGVRQMANEQKKLKEVAMSLQILETKISEDQSIHKPLSNVDL